MRGDTKKARCVVPPVTHVWHMLYISERRKGPERLARKPRPESTNCSTCFGKRARAEMAHISDAMARMNGRINA